jgi:hypothetical protein
LNSNKEFDLSQIKADYENSLKKLSEFIVSGKATKDMTVNEYREQARLFWEGGYLWKQP